MNCIHWLFDFFCTVSLDKIEIFSEMYTPVVLIILYSEFR